MIRRSRSSPLRPGTMWWRSQDVLPSCVPPGLPGLPGLPVDLQDLATPGVHPAVLHEDPPGALQSDAGREEQVLVEQGPDLRLADISPSPLRSTALSS